MKVSKKDQGGAVAGAVAGGAVQPKLPSTETGYTELIQDLPKKEPGYTELIQDLPKKEPGYTALIQDLPKAKRSNADIAYGRTPKTVAKSRIADVESKTASAQTQSGSAARQQGKSASKKKGK